MYVCNLSTRRSHALLGTMASMSATLERTVRFLITESRNVRTRHLLQHLEQGDSSTQLHILKQLLCVRSPYPQLPGAVLQDIDDVLNHERSRRLLTPVSHNQAASRV
jgi:hypothetical protein